jgi:hypothetical protein
MSQKSILEQALLQVNTLEEAVKQNAKGILSSVMKQGLNDLLKEQAEDEELANTPDEEEQDVTGDESGDEETSINDEPMGDEPSSEEDELSSDDEMSDDEMSDDEFADETEDAEDTLDMTGASDEEVLKVFKAMKPEDGIVVKKDGDTISFSDDDDEYIIKLDSEGFDDEMAEGDVEAPMAETDDVMPDEINESDETIYEITLDEDEIENDMEMGSELEEDADAEVEVAEGDDMEVEVAEGDDMEVEATEAVRTKWNPHGGDRAGIKSKKIFKAGSKHGLNEEVENLKKQNAEYKKALVLFKDKLNEVAVFNANLAYATRLFTEHSTTKQEKLNILKRFDSISTIKESKNLYSSIKNELDTKKPMTESVVEKITSTPTTSSTEVLSEAKAYENPQFRRMKDLMSKLK